MPALKSRRSVDRPWPVQEVYDALRDARMNERYYGEKLTRLQRWSLVLDILVAVGTSSAVASLAFWSSTDLRAIPLALGAVATLLTVVKPVLNLSKKVERASTLWASYTGVANSLRRVVADIRRNEGLRDEMCRVYENAIDRLDQLSADDDPAPSEEIVSRIQDAVDREFPADRFWVPASACGVAGNSAEPAEAEPTESATRPHP